MKIITCLGRHDSSTATSPSTWYSMCHTSTLLWSSEQKKYLPLTEAFFLSFSFLQNEHYTRNLVRPPPRLVSPHHSTSSVSTISSSSEETLSELQQFNVTTKSIIFGGSDGVATHSVEVLKCIQANDDKKIFDVLWEGRPAIAKCWTQIDDQRFE